MNDFNLYKNESSLMQLVIEYLGTTNMNKEEFGKRIGYSRSAVSLYVSGKYKSDPSELEEAIRNYFNEIGFVNESEIKSESDIFISNDVKNIMAVCQACHESGSLGAIVGRTGFGKTYTLKKYAQLDKVAYIECDDTMARRDFITAIERSIGLPIGSGSIYGRVNNIKEFFNVNRGYLLIIDEADKLISKDTTKKIETLRTIFDQSEVSILIAGEPELESIIKTFVPRFANRIDFYVNLQGLSKSEAAEYVKEQIGEKDVTDEALRELAMRATNYHTGCFRLLNRTVKNVKRLSMGKDQIDINTIQQASKMMLL